jgi:orotidine-5'-phosphate decarboxylase
MKHVTFADKSLLVDDETADTMLQYAAALARNGGADAVDIHAYSSDGDEVIATLLLDAGAQIMAETSSTSLPGPDNTEALSYMREQLARLSPIAATPVDHKSLGSYEDLDLL